MRERGPSRTRIFMRYFFYLIYGFSFILTMFCAQTSEILIENRYGNVNTQSGNTETTRFCNEFDAKYSTLILESCMKIILSKKTNFVGTKTLCGALKVIQIALKCRRTRVVIQNHITTILYELSLPILLIT